MSHVGKLLNGRATLYTQRPDTQGLGSNSNPWLPGLCRFNNPPGLLWIMHTGACVYTPVEENGKQLREPCELFDLLFDAIRIHYSNELEIIILDLGSRQSDCLLLIFPFKFFSFSNTISRVNLLHYATCSVIRSDFSSLARP